MYKNLLKTKYVKMESVVRLEFSRHQSPASLELVSNKLIVIAALPPVGRLLH